MGAAASIGSLDSATATSTTPRGHCRFWQSLAGQLTGPEAGCVLQPGERANMNTAMAIAVRVRDDAALYPRLYSWGLLRWTRRLQPAAPQRFGTIRATRVGFQSPSLGRRFDVAG